MIDGSVDFRKSPAGILDIEICCRISTLFIRDNMLVTLYDKNKRMFLSCFKKTEKSPQKSSTALDFKGFSKFAYEEGREQIVS